MGHLQMISSASQAHTLTFASSMSSSPTTWLKVEYHFVTWYGLWCGTMLIPVGLMLFPGYGTWCSCSAALVGGNSGCSAERFQVGARHKLTRGNLSCLFAVNLNELEGKDGAIRTSVNPLVAEHGTSLLSWKAWSWYSMELASMELAYLFMLQLIYPRRQAALKVWREADALGPREHTHTHPFVSHLIYIKGSGYKSHEECEKVQASCPLLEGRVL
eukprot:1149572-Pelagomonas_calceolata.AAC.2